MESIRRGNKQLQYESLEERRLLASLEGISAEAILGQQEILRSPVAGEIVVALQQADGIDDLYRYLGDLNLPSESGFQVDSSEELLTSERESGELTIVELELDPNEDVEALSRQLETLAEVAWASPNYRYTGGILDFIPNDIDFTSQYHHQLVQNTVAWDTTLGDSNVIIAVTDDGVDLTHPDLAPNIWVNDDPIDGIDNDGNGFIDDINGWDFVANDNDPAPNSSFDSHGTHVAGIAAAVTNNVTGVAGAAGGASILPIRIAGNDGGFTSTIMARAFAYAIDNGAAIANTSYNIDGFVNDPIFTAGLQYYYDNGGLHFNSAGNGNELNPARQVFTQTLLVVNTSQTDGRSSSSNYGTGVDISAPGTSIFSTLPNGSYGFQSGTSMAAPNAAGAAALIWSANPTWNRDQVAAQLLATADSIDSANPGLEGLLGSGRINTSNLSGVLPAPQVEEIVGLPSDGQFISIDEAPTQFSVSFDQLLDPASANDPNSFTLVNAGANKVFGDTDDFIVPITLETNYMVGTNELDFSIDGSGLANGAYAFAVSTVNPFGTALDGNGDGLGGDAFTTNFEIAAPPLRSVGPLGSIVFEIDQSGSITNGDISQFTVDLDANQLLSVIANPSSTLDLEINVETPSGNFFTYTADGSGLDLVTDAISDSVGGTYTISVIGAGGTTGTFDIQLLVNSNVELETHDGPSNNTLASAQPIDSSALNLGFGSANRLSVLGSLPGSQGTVFAGDDFETGELGSQWTTSSSDPQGRIRVTGEEGTASGSFALLMDNTAGTNVLNEAIWTVDLTGLSAATLEFSHAEWSDEDNVLPTSFVGSVDGDGVSISDDGVNWFTILNSPSTSSGVWTREVVDLVDAAGQAGFDLGDNFQIKFQQFDNLSLTTDGRGYDNIQIITPDVNEDWYSFDLPSGVASTVSLTQLNSGVTNLELYDATGNLVATGIDTNSSEQRISQFVATGGTYFARVTGEDADYNLLVARESEFNEEPGTDSFVQALPDVQSNVVFGHLGSGGVAIEPDDFVVGTVLDTVNEFVTLSTNTGGSIFTATATFGAPTGTIVFAPSVGNASGFSSSTVLRADFANQVSTVSIDAGSDDSSDVSQLQAFAADGTLLETVTSSGLTSGNSETLTISRGSAEIAFILASGVGGDFVALDNLVFDGSLGDDLYSVSTVAGGVLTIDTLTPGDGPFEPRNLLDVGVEIIDPNGIVVASGAQVGNESFSYEAATDGVHTIRVFSQDGAGEYVVQVQNEVGFLVSSVTPSNGDRLTATPSSIVLEFNEPFLASTLQLQDFLLNGTPASGLTVINSQSIELQFANIQQGASTLTIAEGAVLNLISEPLSDFSSTFELDTIGPRVVSSSVQQNEQVSGTNFTFDFAFSERITLGIGADDFSLVDANGDVFASSSFELINGVSDATLSITYDSLPEDNYTLTLISGDGAFEDLFGNDLDGEAVFPLPSNGSGDGVPGGDFAVDFEVEISSIPLVTPFRQVLPAGSATYEQEASGRFSFPSDVDRYEFSVDAGQSITVRLETDVAVPGQVQLHGPNGFISSAVTLSSDAIIQSFFVPQGGDYEVHVVGGNVLGDYSVQVVLNSDLEEETFGIGNNDSPANAQFIPLISPTFTHLRSVVGNLSGAASLDSDDWYRFELAASDTATISVSGQSSSEFLIDLFDSSGLLAQGVAADNLDAVINNVANLSGGTNQYIARVHGDAFGDYQLLLAVNSDFDTEGNDTPENAQPLGPAVAAHGFVDSQSVAEVDWYEFEATVGQTLTIDVSAKSAGPFLIGNSLDPELELYSPSGILLATGNNLGDESFVQSVFESGTYQLLVSAATGTAGEYLLSVTPNVSNSSSPRVVASDLNDGAIVGEFPTNITLDFSESILGTTIQASDLIIGGLPAISLTQLDGDTFVFEVDPAANVGDGDYQVSLAAGAVTDLQGRPVDPYLITFTFDNVGLQITSTTFNGAPLATLTPGPLVFEAFLNEDLIQNTVGPEDFSLIDDISGDTFTPTRVLYDLDLGVVTAEFAFLPEGNYTLTLVSGDGAFEDGFGNDLDGEPLGSGLDGTVTGDGTPGGDYVVSLSVDKPVSAANDFEYLGPLGGLTSASLLNNGVINSPTDTDVYFFSAEAGQLISASVQGADGNVGVQIAGLTSVLNGTDESTLSPVVIPSDGIYGVIVSASQPTDYTLSILNGLISERVSAGNDSSQNNPLAIDASELVLADGARYAVHGVSAVGGDLTSGEAIINGSFETGDFAGWDTAVTGTPFGDWAVSGAGLGGGFLLNPTQPQEGNFVAWNGFEGIGPFEFTLAQNVVVPIEAELSFQYRAQWNFAIGGSFANVGRDFFVEVLDPVTSTPLATVFGFNTGSEATNPVGNTGWVTETINLSAFAGQAVRLQFREVVPEVLTGPAQIEFDAISLTSPDVDEYTIDLSGHVGQPIDIVLDGLNREDFSQQTLELIAPDGTQLATGLSGTATNSQLAITDFVVPANGIYHLRFTSQVSGEYGLVVTPSLAFESESNDQTFLATRSLNQTSGLGHLGIRDNDIFSIDLQAGDSIGVSTQTPFDGDTSSLPNLLDPAITIISSNGTTTLASDLNSAADGKNALVRFTAPTSGTYFVRITATSGIGDYVVTTELLNPIQVTDVVVASSDWTSSFIDAIDGAGTTSGLGLGLTGPDQLRSLPWLSGIDTFHIQFNTDVSATFTKDNLSLLGSSTDYLTSASVTFDSATNIGTITLPAAVTQDALVLSIFDTIATPGTFFDGQWTDAVSTSSGRGTVGDQFHFRTNVLAGDVNGDGVVSLTGDLLPTSDQNTLIPATLAESYFDITGDGVVNVTGDVASILDRNTNLLPAPPALPAAPESDSSLPVNQLGTDFAQGDVSTNLEQSNFGVSTGSVPNLLGDVNGPLGQETDLLLTTPTLSNPPATLESASPLLVSQFMTAFAEGNVSATLEQLYFYVPSDGDANFTGDVTSELGESTNLLPTPAAVPDAPVVPESHSLLPVPFTADFVKEETPQTLEQSYFHVSTDGDASFTAGVTLVLGENANLLPTPPAFFNPPAAIESALQSSVDQFMADFAKEDEEDAKDERVVDPSTNLLPTQPSLPNLSGASELALVSLTDQFMADYAEEDGADDEEDGEEVVFGNHALEALV